MISDILKKVHRKFSKDIDYPETGSEDLLVYLDHADDAITEYEDCAKAGYPFKELLTSAPLVFGGSGTDALQTNFLAFIRRFDISAGGYKKAELLIGSVTYTEVSTSEGNGLAQQGLSPNVFWSEGTNIRTLPAANGTITLPYLKKHTRYVTGAETPEPEMENPKFIEDFVTAKVFLDNADDTLYQSFFASADEKLKQMKYNALV